LKEKFKNIAQKPTTQKKTFVLLSGMGGSEE